MASKKELIESELLVMQYQRGDKKALDKLVALWERPVYYYVRRLVQAEEAARDVAQDVWLNVFRKIRSVRKPAAFPAWLFHIARNKVTDHFRNVSPDEPWPEDGETLEIAGEVDLPAMKAEEVHWALGQISPLHSECVILHYLEGFSLDEIGLIVESPIGTVKSRIYYAKKALRELLSTEVPDHEAQ